MFADRESVRTRYAKRVNAFFPPAPAYLVYDGRFPGINSERWARTARTLDSNLGFASLDQRAGLFSKNDGLCAAAIAGREQ